MSRKQLLRLNRHQLFAIARGDEPAPAGATGHDVGEAMDRLQRMAEWHRLCRECHMRLPRSDSAWAKYCYVTCYAGLTWHPEDISPLDEDSHGNLRLAMETAPSIAVLQAISNEKESRDPNLKPWRWPTAAKRYLELRQEILKRHPGSAPARGRSRIIGRSKQGKAIALICEDVPGYYTPNRLTPRRVEEILEDARRRKLRLPVEIWATGTDGTASSTQEYELRPIAVWPQDPGTTA